MNVMEVRCFRSMSEVTELDRVKNDEVRIRTGVVRELAERAGRRVLQWFEDVETMEEKRLVTEITRSHVRSVRPRGRPQIG